MRTVRISEEVWQEIAERGKFGESVDDVLRRVFGLETATIEESNLKQRTRRNKATNRMGSRVANGMLIVEFATGDRDEFKLPDKTNKIKIREVRDQACDFAESIGATLGQVNAVKKALTDSGYYVSR